MKIKNILERVDCFDSFEEAVEYYYNRKGLFVSSNMESLCNDDISDMINDNHMTTWLYPDGIGCTLPLKFKLDKTSIKIPGCELWLAVIRRNILEYGSCNIALIGATQDVNNETSRKLTKDFECVNIAYSKDGFDFDIEKEVQTLSNLDVDFIFIAMGQPLQEQIACNVLKLNPNLSIYGVGGSFDVYSGNSKRAPNFLVSNNLEWLYRLCKQPKRAGRVFKSATTLAYRLFTNK